jgi:triacylglycerol lipase
MDTTTAVPKLRAPVVLVHGLFGFDAFRTFDVELIPYFRGIQRYLGRPGNRVYTARLSPTGRLKRRAVQLRQYLDRVAPDGPVHLIAHSMGGLDSRYAIARLGAADRVLTLTTLGTPHRGTSFADWGLTRWGMLLQPSKLAYFRPVPALLDLTTEACRRFNELTPDAPGVRYFSVAGRYGGRWWMPTWRFAAKVIAEREGDNDGLVSVESARYGETFDLWDGDHMSLVNWPTVQSVCAWCWCDRRPQYARIVQRLRELGY